MVVVKFSGADRYLNVNGFGGRLTHLVLKGKFSVTPQQKTLLQWQLLTGEMPEGQENVFDGSESVERFSSDGPRRIFYEIDGTPVTPGNFLSSGGMVRQKPTISAADGVSTATSGFTTFFGTSAAAPHAAAIAALALSMDPSATVSDIREALITTTYDIEARGIDRDSGYGILNAFKVLEHIADSIPAQVSYEKVISSTQNESSRPHQVRVVLSTGGSKLKEEVRVDVSDTMTGSATAEGIDYKSIGKETLSFPAGSPHGAMQTVIINVVDDAFFEGDETISLILENVTGGAILGENTGHIITITDDDSLNNPPTANDDDAETEKGESVVIDVIENDMDDDGKIDPTSVMLVSPRYVASFDGMDDRLTWGNLGLNGTPVISKFIRFRTTTARGVLFDYEFNGNFDGGLGIWGGHLQLRCGFENSGVKIIDIVASTTAADGEWHSAGFTYDGVTLRAYFDGLESGTSVPVEDSIRHNYVSICGRRTISKSMYFQGELSDFVVYSSPLSREAVLLYHSGEVAPNNLRLWGKMDESDYTGGLTDSSENGHTGLSAGAVPVRDPSAISMPVNGSVVINSNGTVIYTPNPGFFGEDFFKYTVADNDHAITNIATVKIKVRGDRPPIAVDDEAETSQSQIVTINVVKNDMEPDGNINPASVTVVEPRNVASFDGINDYITWGDLGLDGTIQVSKFIRFRTTTPVGVLFDYELNRSFDGGIGFGTEGILQLRCGFYNSGVKIIGIVSASDAADGQWHTAGFTYDGLRLRAYFDGLQSGISLSVVADTIRHNYVSICGRRTKSNSRYFNGELANFLVYDQAVSAKAVLGIHKEKVELNGLVLWGKMDEKDYLGGLMDSSGNHHLGFNMGAVPMPDPAAIPRPAKGTAISNSDGTITYTPNRAFVGKDNFVYTVANTDGARSNMAEVTIRIFTPPLAADDKAETNEGKNVTINVIENDTDPAGNVDPKGVMLIGPRNVASFGGRNDHITWGDLELDGAPRISKFIRFRTTTPSGVLFDYELNGRFDAGVGFRRGHLQLRCGFYNSGVKIVDIVNESTAADGQWHSVGFTYDGLRLLAYFDGIKSGPPVRVAGGTIPHNYISICGRRTLSNSMFYKGQLSDFVVYNDALPLESVLSYHKGEVEFDDLVLWGKMDENDYSEGLADASGNDHRGSSIGAIAIVDPVAILKPANGTVVNNGDGTVTYMPNPGFVGIDSFDYRLGNGVGAFSDIVSVTIVVNDSFISASKLTIQNSNEFQINPRGFNWLNPSVQGVIVSQTVYEDAEDGTIDGWKVYGDGKVLNVRDALGNRIISTKAKLVADPFRLALPNQGNWDNTSEFTTYFAVMLQEEAAVYFRVDTSNGEKYLCYTSGPEIFHINKGTISFGLGIQADSQWYAINRNLANDLERAIPNAKLISVKDFYVFGSLMLDDLMLLNVNNQKDH